jgi:hypothetical protein
MGFPDFRDPAPSSIITRGGVGDWWNRLRRMGWRRRCSMVRERQALSTANPPHGRLASLTLSGRAFELGPFSIDKLDYRLWDYTTLLVKNARFF